MAKLVSSQRFAAARIIEGWQYGSGLDYAPPVQQTVMDPKALERARKAAASARAFRPVAPAMAAAPK